jgi:hypothetical protein
LRITGVWCKKIAQSVLQTGLAWRYPLKTQAEAVRLVCQAPAALTSLPPVIATLPEPVADYTYLLHRSG